MRERPGLSGETVIDLMDDGWAGAWCESRSEDSGGIALRARGPIRLGEAVSPIQVPGLAQLMRVGD